MLGVLKRRAFGSKMEATIVELCQRLVLGP
jgi:hypothetical protein